MFPCRPGTPGAVFSSDTQKRLHAALAAVHLRRRRYGEPSDPRACGAGADLSRFDLQADRRVFSAGPRSARRSAAGSRPSAEKRIKSRRFPQSGGFETVFFKSKEKETGAADAGRVRFVFASYFALREPTLYACGAERSPAGRKTQAFSEIRFFAAAERLLSAVPGEGSSRLRDLTAVG